MKCLSLLLLFGLTSAVYAQGMHPVAKPKKPMQMPAGIPPSSYICTGEIISKDGRMTRVFRYSYQTNVASETKRLTGLLTKKGWKREVIHSRTLLEKRPKGDVAEQAILIFASHVVFDKSQAMWCRTVRDPGWIWLSYNEIYSVKETRKLIAAERSSGK